MDKCVGVIGLGIIGSRVAANLKKAGFDVHVWSRSRKSIDQFADSPQAVAGRCKIIQLFVSNDEAVLETIKKMADALTPEHLVLVHSTISPDTIRRAQSEAKSSGAHLIDAPFTGSKNAAESGQLVYYLAGDEEDLERADPVLAASRKASVKIGKFGDASLIKIVTNMITAAAVQAVAEALAITEKAGIDPQKLVAAIDLNACRSPVVDMKLKSMIDGDYSAHFSVLNMLKDSRLALTLGKNFAAPLPVTDVIAQQLAEAEQRGWQSEDFSAIARLVRQS